MDPSFEAQLREDAVTFDERDAALLEAIREEGSLNRAAKALGRSYSRCQNRLGELESAFGTLVDRTRGGAGGGGSSVTEDGEALLARFERLRTSFAAVANVTETVIGGTVTDRTGEIAEIETPVGSIRALVPPGLEEVQVTIRDDAVTLHEPGAAPRAGGTSARNRFEGTVSAITTGEHVHRVRVDLGADVSLEARITEESRTRLDIEPGTAVVATFKATAARCTEPRDR